MAVLTLDHASAQPEDLWFFADGDSPAVMAGEVFGAKFPESAFVDGKFGKAVYFRRKTSNDLPPMARFLNERGNFSVKDGAKLDPAGESLKFSGGEFTIAPRPIVVPTTHVHKDGSYTMAFEVRGKAGTTVTLTPVFSSVTNGDHAVASTNVLKGTEWQRVWACAVVLGKNVAGRKVSLNVKATGPVEMRRFLYQTTGMYPYQGLRHPGEWVDGGGSRGDIVYSTTERSRLKSFPHQDGSFSCWFRSDDADVSPWRAIQGFGYNEPWAAHWHWTGGFHTSPEKRGGVGPDPKLKIRWRTGEWRHFAATWNRDAARLYLDGELIGETKEPALIDLSESKKDPVFTVGAGCYWSGATDLMMDEISIFKHALTGAEVKELATATKARYADGAPLMASPVEFATFARGDGVSKLRLNVFASAEGDFDFALTAGEVKYPPRKVKLAKGDNAFTADVNPGDFRPGEYPVRLLFTRADGSVALDRRGRVKVLPSRHGGVFPLISWGSGGRDTMDFYRDCGLNQCVVWSSNRLGARTAVEAGLDFTVRLENSGEWKNADFDRDRLAKSAAAKIAWAKDCPQWKSTLVNSEVYSDAAYRGATNLPLYRKWARESLGFEPVYAIKDGPSALDMRKLGKKNPRGVFEPDEAYKTLDWIHNRGGSPVGWVNRVDRDVVHAMKPGIPVWSEPHPPIDDIDMQAGWFYEYQTADMLAAIARSVSSSRARGIAYLPTLSMSYWPEVTCKLPDGKTYHAVQTADELIIKSWMAIASTPAWGFSYFSPDWSWFNRGEKEATKRYGEFLRGDFNAVLRLLRGVQPARARIAVLAPSTIDLVMDGGYGRYHMLCAVSKYLAKSGLGFDVLGDEEFDLATLSRYDYLVAPHFFAATRAQHEVLKQLPKATKVLLDSSGMKDCPNAEVVKDFDPHWGVFGPTYDKCVRRPLDAYFAPHRGELRAKAVAWSEPDGTNSWTFVKEYGGAKYVVVVNDARRKGGCPQTEIITNSFYRPCSAPQTITTHFNGPGVIYALNGKETVGGATDRERTFTADYASSEGRLFCIYPKAIDKLALKLVGEPKAGGSAALEVRLADADGGAIPGRQLVRLTLAAPDGTERDESGVYVAENGRVSIRLDFARGEEPGGFFSKWKAEVSDLASGVSDSLRFALD